MNRLLLAIAVILTACCIQAQPRSAEVRHDVPLDAIRLSDPAILADQKTKMYYMTGTGGLMWRSRDLNLWDGPYHVTQFEHDSWMGPRPMIWAAELHQTGDGKYYYFATFTNQAVKIDTVRGNVIERRASQVLRAENPMGPYRAFGDDAYLPANRPTLDGTFWRDADGKPYMVFCGEWLQNWNGTIEKIELKPDMSGTIGEPTVLFRASDSPWSKDRDEQGKDTWNKVTDGPWLFRTGTGRLGMLWTSWIYDVYTQGVAYSESGTLDGPWHQESFPITPPGFGHSMLFQRFDGQWMMAVHHHSKDSEGRTVRIPHLFEVDLSGDKLALKDNHANGAFSTRGTQLIDAVGQPFVVVGVNNPHAWFGERAYKALDDIAATRVNTVRIVWDTHGQAEQLERIIQRCITLKMIPMVELHDVTGSSSGQRLLDMVGYFTREDIKTVLKRHQRYLLINIANEWGGHDVDTQHWLNSYTAAVAAMRKAGFTTTLVVDGPGWGQNIQPILESGGELITNDPLHNILFSVHMYGSWNDARDIVEKLTAAKKKGLPLIVGEFGYNSDDGRNNLRCQTDHRTIMATCRQLGYGFMPWSWTGNNKENAWLDIVDSRDWKTPTWWGHEVIDGEWGIRRTAIPAKVFDEQPTSPNEDN